MGGTDDTPYPAFAGRGVNIAGYFDSTLGVGEVARQLRDALDAADVPFESFVLPERRSSGPAASPPPPTPPFPTTIVCANAEGIEGARSWLGPEFFAGHVIAVWWWELELFPDRWRRSFDGLDEIWAFSHFVGDAIQARSPVPVVTFPLPLATRASAPSSRAELGLPEGFVFLFVFDFASGFVRKNPIGVIEAFSRAFQHGSGASLLIKHVGGDEFPLELEALTTAARAHPDVHLVDGRWPAEQQAALVAGCDCYVSLHRSEGFGLTLAEAVLADKPVISTGYSGPLDFLDAESSYLVGHRMVTIGPGNEPYPAEARWAEPDVGHAARLMQAVRSDPAESAARAARARAGFESAHSPATAGRAMGQRVEWLQGTSRASSTENPELDTIESLVRTWPPREKRAAPAWRRILRRIGLRLAKPQAMHQSQIDVGLVGALRTLDERLRALENREETSGRERPASCETIADDD